MFMTLLLASVLTGSHTIASTVPNQNPCSAPRAIGDAAGFNASSVSKSPSRHNGLDEIQMMSRLVGATSAKEIGWMYVDQGGRRWIQLSDSANKREHGLFSVRYIPERPGYDYQTVYPFNQSTLPNGIRLESCEMR